MSDPVIEHAYEHKIIDDILYVTFYDVTEKGKIIKRGKQVMWSEEIEEKIKSGNYRPLPYIDIKQKVK